ncbi:MAG: efflux RND transporter permease subunit [Gammaproteobacteria bacterium]|nr:efflux RND transporter permease subunit [Gammaproteobacteria bacterium]
MLPSKEMQNLAPGQSGTGLINWFIRNPVAANLLMVVLLVGGALSAVNLQRQVFPTISPGTVVVTVPYPGATPAEVEEGVTRRVEEAVLGIDGVKRVNSTASENVGRVVIETSDFADVDIVKDDVESAVDRLSDFPPENAEKPVVVAPKPTGGVVTLAVVGDLGAMALRRAAEGVERDLLTQRGVSLVSLEGDRDLEISIEVSESTLRRYDLTFEDVANAVRQSSLDLAGGSIVSDSGEILLRTNQKRQSGEAFESVVIRTRPDGSVITLADIADIDDGFVRKQLRNVYNGRPAVFVRVSRAEAEDVLQVKEAVDNFLAGYSPPPGVELIELRDETQLLRERVNLLLRNGAFGFALVFLFLVLMLDLRLAVWVSAGIATAFMGGIMLFGALGVTITMISLFGLIIVLGLVVDDAIVIGENIDAEQRQGVDGESAASRGAHRMLAPVVVGVLTTVAAFAPLLVTGGTFGDITRAIPLVVISVLLVSLLEAFCILPAHLSHGRSWSRGPLKRLQTRIAAGIGWARERLVRSGVAFAAKWRYATLGFAVAFFILCIGLLQSGQVRFIFFPAVEGNSLSASLTMPDGTPFERTDLAVQRMTDAAYQVAEEIREDTGETLFVSVTSTSGGNASSNNGPGGQSSFSGEENIGQVRIELTPFGQRVTPAAEIERRWRSRVGRIEGAERVSYSSSFVRFGSDVEFELAHQDEALLVASVEDLKQRLAQVDGINQIEDSFDLGKRQLVFELTPAGGAAGLREADIATQVRRAFFGEEVQRIQRGREEVRVYVRYPASTRTSLDALDNFRVQLPGGDSAPLLTVASVEESRAYSSIERIDGRRVVTVSADVDEAISTPNIANEAILASVMPALEQEYPGLRWVRAGSAREQNEDLASLGSAFIVVLLIIFTLIATQLRSYIQPLAILVAIPLGVAGAVLGHFVLGFALSFISIFGIVALAGVAVNASVVLVDLYNQYRAEGKSPVEAAADSAARRFRPVLLTTLTTALGLAPLLFEKSPQAQFLIPMAVSLGFGIVISGFMVLFVTPTVAVIIDDWRARASTRDSAPSGARIMNATGETSKHASIGVIAAFAICLVPSVSDAADLDLRLENAPDTGTLIVQIYDAADAFSDLRDPAQEYSLAAVGDGLYALENVSDGEIAVLVYHDENENGLIDKNFIGIPRELLAMSNAYQPKGPPSFARASFNMPSDEPLQVGMEMYKVLGERGRFGLGLGAIGRSSPYRESSGNVTRVIPAVTYVGERLQWFGPALRYGIYGSGKLRLAAAAEYRIGVYEEADSNFLSGLGDRRDTLLGGVGLQYEISEGFELELLYQHDVIDRIGGGMANVRLSRGIPWGSAVFVPQLAYNWLGSDMSNHDSGVPESAATPERPAYRLGSTSSVEAGLGVFVELTESWRIIVNVAAERLDDSVVNSPIVDDDTVIKGVALITYVF